MCLAIPARIVELLPDPDASAIVDVVGVRRRVSLGLLDEASVVAGDWVLIHVGFAMSRISEADAHEQMRMLEALGEATAAMEEVRGYGLDEQTELAQTESDRMPREGEAAQARAPADRASGDPGGGAGGHAGGDAEDESRSRAVDAALGIGAARRRT